MSIYGHFSQQYFGSKNIFPEESFLIAGISFYHENLKNINFDSELKLKTDPKNKFDTSAIQIIFNNKCIGYVPNDNFLKNLCIKNINSKLKIINIKRVPESKKYGIRVILENYYSDSLKNIGIL